VLCLRVPVHLVHFLAINNIATISPFVHYKSEKQ
jgi:hypothetical protein